MPQTREHLAICELLGVASGVVAITKSDLVDAEIAELVELEVRELLADTALADAPIVRTSVPDASGLDGLRDALAGALQATTERPSSSFVRLPVDRVFTMRGFGTVVTGTLLSGSVAPGDKLELLPTGELINVRGVQVYGEAVAQAGPGQRTAVNLQGIDVDQVSRGDLLVTPGCLAPGYLIDARVRMLPGHGLEHLQRTRFHHGAAEILCRVALLQPDDLGTGGSGLAQLRLESPYACVPGDRFVLRRYSPMLTIGGGVVLDNTPHKHRRSDTEAGALLEALERAGPGERLALLVADAGDGGATEGQLRQRMFATGDELSALANELTAAGELVIVQSRPLALLDGARAAALEDRLLSTAGDFHADNPLVPTVPKSVLAAALPHASPAVLDALVERLVEAGQLHETGDGVALAGHRVALSEEQEHTRNELLRVYEEAAWAPPVVAEAIEASGAPVAQGDEILHLLLRSGDLVRVRDDLVYHAARLEKLVDELRDRYQPGESFGVGDFKQWTGLSRKHAIPLLEYLDQNRVTRREGDVRVRL
jgi:selenocysteine-specific elongation factor